MRTTIFFTTSSLVLALGACTPDVPADESDSSETGDGDGDPGDGDGDGDPGDGDGDGDQACECPDDGSWDQCGVAEQPLLVHSTFTWPPNTTELELDEICTVASIDAGVTVTLDCPAGEISIAVDTEPAWVPAFAVGEQVHLQASESLGMSEGDDWHSMRWRIDRADDSAMLANYINSGTSEPNFIGDPYMIEVVDGVCQRFCEPPGNPSPEWIYEDVGVRFIAEADELLLFAGQRSELGDHLIRVGAASQRECTDADPGGYNILITHTEAPADACALVLDQSYSSQEQLECGIGPNGVVLCNWTIAFDGSQYLWSFSDVGSSGDYSCAGLNLLSVPEGDTLGSVSPDGAVLTWDGVLYDRD
ncbi:MAG TPA: hypothetical protein VM869_08340 [Enhygromyxa sp.]|nr:hypothetical protein [Enhygromyxa sp.]